MKIAEVQFNMWESPKQYLAEDENFKIHDYVLVDADQVTEIGKIIGLLEIDEKGLEKLKKETELTQIIKKADLKDLEVLENFENEKNEILEVCRKLIVKNNLPMKLVDVHRSFDSKKITFAFISDGRVDFRQLVKDLTKHYQKNIRLQQLGVRDEAKINGDVGACGLVQCCRSYLKVLGNVSAEQAEVQQVSHRGAERLSGICNRLKCCLRYENDLYKDLAQKFPPKGTQVKTPHGKGEVVDWHILKQTVSVKIGDEGIVEVPIDQIH